MDKDILVVPVANPDTATPLLETAIDLARGLDLAVDVVHIVSVPSQIPLVEGQVVLDVEQEELVDEGVETLEQAGIEARGRIRFARSVPRGVLGIVKEPAVQTLLMGWRGRHRKDIILGSNLDTIVNRAQADVLIERVYADTVEIDSILLPVADGPHTSYAAHIAGTMAREHDAAIEVLHIIEPEASDAERARADRLIDDALDAVGTGPDLTRTVAESKDVAEGIHTLTAKHDLTVLGSARDGVLSRVLFGEVAESVGRSADSRVILAKEDLGIRYRLPWLHRWF